MRLAACAQALLLVLSAGCGGNGKQAEPAKGESAESEPAKDEPKPPAPASDSRAALAGSWSGATSIPGYGSVVATFTLDNQGSGYYFVSAGGRQEQGPFKLLSWEKGYLLVEAKGHQERVHATHRGDKLWVDHTLIGQVLLVREPK